MHTYIYICTFVCVNACISVCECTYVCMYIYLYTHAEKESACMTAATAGNKVSVSCVNWDMRTALHVAVSSGHVSIVEKQPGGSQRATHLRVMLVLVSSLR